MPSDDPLDELLRPPAGETADEQALRVAAEEHARQISLKIDQQIKAERQARGKKRIVRLLLLGQSESGEDILSVISLYSPSAGKSTTLRRKSRTGTVLHQLAS